MYIFKDTIIFEDMNLYPKVYKYCAIIYIIE